MIRANTHAPVGPLKGSQDETIGAVAPHLAPKLPHGSTKRPFKLAMLPANVSGPLGLGPARCPSQHCDHNACVVGDTLPNRSTQQWWHYLGAFGSTDLADNSHRARHLGGNGWCFSSRAGFEMGPTRVVGDCAGCARGISYRMRLDD